jgi:RimJ/RimL family protein N-acetyltransferase
MSEYYESAANVVLISESNAHLLLANFDWALPLAESSGIEPIFIAVKQEQAVAICFCSRRPAQATEAGVETLPEFRGKGYATAVVAAWAAEVSRRGTIPMYSTSWDNLASQAIARKLQMVCYGEDWAIR